MHPEIKLIIVDTFKMIRGTPLPRETPYDRDYREMAQIKQFLDDRKVSALFIHHNRKMLDESDPFNMISGTNGIMGACDTIWVLTKEKRDSEEAVLHITGRDVEQTDTVIRFDPKKCRWESLGDADSVKEKRLRDEYEESPVIKTIKYALDQSADNTWKGSSSELMKLGQAYLHSPIAESAQAMGYKLNEMEDLLNIYDGIVHKKISNGKGSKKHFFFYQGQ